MDFIQKKLFKEGAGVYEATTKKLIKSYNAKTPPDGEILFLVADPEAKIKGVGSALIEVLATEVKGKRLFLHTDDACSHQFYDKRGFERVEEEQILMDLPTGKIPLNCFIYDRQF